MNQKKSKNLVKIIAPYPKIRIHSESYYQKILLMCQNQSVSNWICYAKINLVGLTNHIIISWKQSNVVSMRRLYITCTKESRFIKFLPIMSEFNPKLMR